VTEAMNMILRAVQGTCGYRKDARLTARALIANTLLAVVVMALCSCGSTPQYLPNYRPDLSEDTPYPEVTNLRLDGIPFGFRIIFYSGLYQMDVAGTISSNMLSNNDASEALKVLEAIDTPFPDIIKPPSGPEIEFKGKPKGQDTSSRSQIEYHMKVDNRGRLLEFVKEISVRNKGYLIGPPVTAAELQQPLFKSFGAPHSVHSEDHAVSHVDTYWWGVDEKVLTKGGTYNFLNAHWTNRFFGKVIRADLYQYKGGDMRLTVTMTDNYLCLQKRLR